MPEHASALDQSSLQPNTLVTLALPMSFEPVLTALICSVTSGVHNIRGTSN
jgi:hypothetical protein